ncbi:MAG TPA: triose-phosphate isomerase, partial [Bdellovibrionota bacterium]|nr:triose-phosphate isomerase [Bdellovibrionota bacterium]
VSLETAARVVAQFSAFPIEIGAQNAHWEKSGAYTGETSGAMLEELRVRGALVGHSERRQHFSETDELVRRRAEGLLAQGFDVILCVGETRAEREGGKTEHVLERQLTAALSGNVAPHLNGRLTIAYEPVWAIGTGLNATPEQAEKAQAFVRRQIASIAGEKSAAATPILYGGSVTPENAAELLAGPNIDGCLVGGASLKPDSFLALLSAGFAAV